MEYRVEEIAGAARVRVDTLRFYQARGLLPAPRKRGRVAIYDDEHLERLRRIRQLQREGFSLAQIQRLLSDSEEASSELLAALSLSLLLALGCLLRSFLPAQDLRQVAHLWNPEFRFTGFALAPVLSMVLCTLRTLSGSDKIT